MENITNSKRMIILTVLGFLALILFCIPAITNARTVEHSSAVETGHFKMLDDHGEWIENAKFGRVWQPHVVANWRPFLYGEWIWVDDAWFWDSYEPFGWLVYHYGNWYYINGTGWVWIPGYNYSPARVTWIDFDDYIGWAPLPPAEVFWPDPWDIGPLVCWNIVLIRDFHHHEIDKHIVTTPITKPKEVARIARKAPEIGKIETVTNSKVEKVKTNQAHLQEGTHSLKQVQLPKEHLQRTQPFRDRINRQVLVPKMVRRH